MLQASVCTECRREALRRLQHTLRIQRLSRASFVSLANNQPKPEPTKEAERERPPPREPAQKPRDGTWIQFSHLFANKNVATKLNSPGRYSRYSREPEEELSPSIGPESVDTNPQDVDQTKHLSQPSSRNAATAPPVTPETSPLADQLTWSPVDQLKALLNQPTAAWSFFVENFPSAGCPALAVLPDTTELQRAVFPGLLKVLTTSWCHSPSRFPTPTEVATKMIDLQVMTFTMFDTLLWHLLPPMIKGGFENAASGHVVAIGHETLSVWSLMYKVHGRNFDPKKESKPNSLDWRGLPDPRTVRFDPRHGPKYRNVGFRIFNSLTRCPAVKQSSLAAAAVCTFDMLVARKSKHELPADYDPFLQFITQILYRCDLESTLFALESKLSLCRVDEEAVRLIVGRVGNAPFRAALALGTQSLDALNEKKGITPEQAGSLEEQVTNRLGRVLENRDPQGLEKMWEYAQKAFRTNKGSKGIPSKVYGLFLYTACGLRQTHFSVDVWNHMFEHKVKPTIAHWTAMMQGFGKIKDAESLESVWHRMLASGMAPDMVAWTARIHGLMTSNRVDHGLHALNEMSEAWIVAAKRSMQKKRTLKFEDIGDLPDAPKPSTETLNVVINSLAVKRRTEQIQGILRWAGGYGIKPDTVTFNVLIRMCLGKGDVQEAFKLLEQMQSLSINPDVVTFGIILDGIFRHTGKSVAYLDEQSKLLVSVLQALQAHGLEPNTFVFSTLIDGLLKKYTNLPAAQAILAHMDALGIAPSPHIYTSFITHFFQQQPVPDLAAVDALWAKIRKENRRTDSMFYDRMIEGYSRVGDVGNAMAFLGRMSREGRRPAWPALTDVVRALVEAGQRVRAQELVRDIAASDGMLKDGVRDASFRTRSHQDYFWNMVRDMGLEEGWTENNV
ncbi:hypothetical protein EJ06DRAFT_534081 [Trichodelitschia bisporula]|uniref:Pentatricopeptide repeat protein n=1 Tax=Trichodelitschia bisporula TaxID=703511 RepID=A0A6G1HKC1_9PEZI|nr:hypothetical protein EJ06DRAFT_534081 [Trichodelitschia bisporula]